MLVRETLYFERKKDPHHAIGIGKRYLIEQWLEEMSIKYCTINDDFSIDSESDVILADLGLTEIPSFIQFRKVEGFFSCSYNSLTSLRGVPDIVGDDFYCKSNLLTTLKYCPRFVRWGFDCDYNNLVSLEGAPNSISGSFSCQKNSVQFTEEDVKKVCKVGAHIYV